MRRPLVIPEPFKGEGPVDLPLREHRRGEQVGCSSKLQWLKVRLAGRAQAALQRFSAEDAADYSSVKERLQERFEPSCRKERHRTELQTVRRKKDEGCRRQTERTGPQGLP